MPLSPALRISLSDVWKATRNLDRAPRTTARINAAVAAFEKELELDHDAPGFRIEAAVVGVLVERYALNKNPDSFITAFSNYLWECQENRSKTCPRG